MHNKCRCLKHQGKPVSACSHHSISDITNKQIPLSKVLPEKLTGPQLVKKFLTFYGTRKFITAFTTAHHLSMSSARSINVHAFPSHFLKIHCNAVLIHAWVFQMVSFTQISPPKPCMHLSCLPYMPHAPSISYFLIIQTYINI